MEFWRLRKNNYRIILFQVWVKLSNSRGPQCKKPVATTSQTTDLDVATAFHLGAASENDKALSKIIRANPKLKLRQDMSLKSNVSYVDIDHSPELEKRTYYHYDVSRMYWIHVEDLTVISKIQFNDFMFDMPYSFKFLQEECCRVGEQTSRDIYKEFLTLELYLRSHWDKTSNDSIDTIFNGLKAYWR